MMSNLLKLLPSMLAVLAFSYGFGEEGKGPGQGPSYEQGHAAAKEQMVSAYNAPGRIDVKGAWDFFASASFIYWKAMEEGLDVGIQRPTTLSTGTGHILYTNFKYKPGFQVGLGMNFNHDDWNLMAEYTRLHCKNKKNHSYSTSYILPFWFYTLESAETLTSAKGIWKLRYDIIDLHLGRPYYTGTNLIFKPEFGLRGGWINQNFKAEYTTDAALLYYSKSTQHDWLIGPRASLGMDFLLGCDFVLFGKTALGLYFQKITNKYKMIDHDASTIQTTRSQKCFLTPNLELGVGLGWGTYFADNSWHFDVRLGYDFLIYWNQNHMRRLADKSDYSDLETTESAAGNLMMHGLTLTVRFDF